MSIVVVFIEAETPALQKYFPTWESLGLCPFSSQDLWEGSEDAYPTDQRTEEERTSGQGHCTLISFSLFPALLLLPLVSAGKADVGSPVPWFPDSLLFLIQCPQTGE